MEDILRDLLNRLGEVGDRHEEIYDSECRDCMSNAVFDGFLRPLEGFVLASDFGLYSPEANAAVREILAAYIREANARAKVLQLRSFHERLSAFQNGQVRSDRGDYFDDLFGYARPDAFGPDGTVTAAS